MKRSQRRFVQNEWHRAHHRDPHPQSVRQWKVTKEATLENDGADLQKEVAR